MPNSGPTRGGATTTGTEGEKSMMPGIGAGMSPTSTILAPGPDLRDRGQEAKVAAVWDRHWRNFDAARLDALYQRLAEPAPWYRRTFVSGPQNELEFFARTLGSLAGVRTLEFGSGIGWTSLWLARAGATATLADISAEALRLSRQVFARAACSGEWRQASVFTPDTPAGGHDLVFNSGVIEHFRRDDQLRMVRNMAEQTRPGGHVALFAPYAGGRLYVWSKRRLEELGKWTFGDEFPLQTMRDLGAEAGLEPVREETSKPGDQWNFLAGVHPRLARVGKVVHLCTLGDVTPIWRWCMGDSMIATIFRKPA